MTARGSSAGSGRVLLVGAGPGAPDLITVRGASALGRAEVVLYDALASEELLSLAPDDALLINVGKRGHDAPTRSQEEINALLVEHGRAGRLVVRLKGGDPFVFGRGGEEATALAQAGIPFEVIPGVSSAIAAPAYAGIPITDRRHSASFAVVTGHKDPSRPARETRWGELGRAVDTVVILMGMRNLSSLVAKLIEGGKAPATPAAAIMHGTTPEQRVVVSRLAELPERVAAAGIGSPAAVVVGSVVGMREQLAWWEGLPLLGMRTLVTGSRQQAKEIASALHSAGAIPVVRTMIELALPENPQLLAEIDDALLKLRRYDVLLFNSTEAVRFFVSAMRRAGLAARLDHVRPRIVCIGGRTARAAMEAGLPVHMVAPAGADAEPMLQEILRSGSARGNRVLIPCSETGPSVLHDGLREAGAVVDALPLYRSVPAALDGRELCADLAAGTLPILTFTSPSVVTGFVSLLDGPARAAVGRCIIAAIGPSTRRALEEIGLPPDVVPSRPDAHELVAVLSEYVSAGRDDRAFTRSRAKAGSAGYFRAV